MKTKLQKKLAIAAPRLCVSTTWEHDSDCKFRETFQNRPKERPENWQCWQSTVSARVIFFGELIEGCAYLGGTWEKYGDHPHRTNPTISGYEPQKTEEALEELRKLLVHAGAKTSTEGTALLIQIVYALREVCHKQP